MDVRTIRDAAQTGQQVWRMEPLIAGHVHALGGTPQLTVSAMPTHDGHGPVR
jgi:hypothetical protein